MESSEGNNGVFSSRLRRKSIEKRVRTLESTSVIRTRRLASGRECETAVFALQTTKSFAVLSVRERSSGNSAPTMPHNRRKTNTETRTFPGLIRVDDIMQPLGELIWSLIGFTFFVFVLGLPRIGVNRNAKSTTPVHSEHTAECSAQILSK